MLYKFAISNNQIEVLSYKSKVVGDGWKGGGGRKGGEKDDYTNFSFNSFSNRIAALVPLLFKFHKYCLVC
jgi:hypothetical protein